MVSSLAVRPNHLGALTSLHTWDPSQATCSRLSGVWPGLQDFPPPPEVTLNLIHSRLQTTGVGGWEFEMMASDSRRLCYLPHIPPLPPFPSWARTQGVPGLSQHLDFLPLFANSEPGCRGPAWQVVLTMVGEAESESCVGHTLSHPGELGEARPVPSLRVLWG